MGNETFDESLLEILACPKCVGKLEYRPEEAVFLCNACRLRYRIDDGIPVLLIDEAEPF
ncbi:MAG: Trm112 family protein [Gemmatimonadetes bacterium]|nr:Trm112 family protein [Gemmatimonadota bacterium]NIO30889.1 Trm112 family protein [Gemmatimonadota bacterium]